MSNTDYERYDEVYDKVMRDHTTSMFKNTYAKGWYLSQIVKMPDGKWLLKWERDIISNPVPDKLKEQPDTSGDENE